MTSICTRTDPSPVASASHLSRRDYLVLATAGLAVPLLSACDGSSGATALFPVAPPAAVDPESVRWCRQAIRAALARSDSQTSAVSVALLADDRVVWREAFGYADRTQQLPATPDTRFNVASIAKVLTALAVMILRDRGQLALDQPLVELLPGFRMQSPGFTRITVRHLLSHASGVPGYNFRNGYNFAPYLDYAQDTFEVLASSHLKHEPGELAVYCNDGFTLMELLVRQLSGLSFIDFVQREIFEPLGMRLSGFTDRPSPEGTFVHPYEAGRSLPQELGASYATGGLLTTPTDMMKLARLFLDEGTYEGRRIVSAEAVREMGRDQSARTRINPSPGWRWGLGWDSVRQLGMDAAGLRGWTKNGGSNFFYTEFHVLPEARLAMLVTGCGFDYDGLALAEGLLLRAAQERGAIRARPAAIVLSVPSALLPVPDTASLAGIYANFDSPFQVVAESDGSLTLNRWARAAWTPVRTRLRARSDGHWWADGQSAECYRFQAVAGHRYLVRRGLSADQAHWSEAVTGEWLPPLPAPLPAAWRARVGSRWLCVNESAETVMARFGPNTAQIDELGALPGYVMLTVAQPPGHDFLHLVQLLRVVDDQAAAMTIKGPGNSGRDLFELRLVTVDCREVLQGGGLRFERLPTPPRNGEPACAP